NAYCIGCKSYPGDVIARERELDVERPLAGRPGDQLEGYVPPARTATTHSARPTCPAPPIPQTFSLAAPRGANGRCRRQQCACGRTKPCTPRKSRQMGTWTTTRGVRSRSTSSSRSNGTLEKSRLLL